MERTGRPDTYYPAGATSQAGWGFGFVIFLLLFAYYWIGLETILHFGSGTGTAPSAATAAITTTTTNNLLNQVVVILLFVMAIGRIWSSPGRPLIFSPHGLLALILIWFCLVSLLAPEPATAFRRIIYALIVVGCAQAVLLLPRNSHDFARGIAISVSAVLLISYVGVIAFPQMGKHMANEVEAALAGDWRGIFGHKNTAAAAMVYLAMFGLYLRSSAYARTGSIAVLLSVVFLIFTGGKTATAMLPTVLVLAWLFERARPLRFLTTLAPVFALNIVLIGLSSFPTLQAILKDIGIDVTFTGRSAIWAFAVERIFDHPLTGYGFQSFWGSDYLRYLTTESWAFLAAHSHNSFLETLINGGFPALVLMCLWLLILPYRDAGAAFATDNDRPLTRLFLRIWIFSILLAGLENIVFVNSGPIWFTMLISIFGLRLQGRASLNEPDTRR